MVYNGIDKIDGWMKEWMDGLWINKWQDGWMDERMDGRMKQKITGLGVDKLKLILSVKNQGDKSIEKVSKMYILKTEKIFFFLQY